MNPYKPYFIEVGKRLKSERLRLELSQDDIERETGIKQQDFSRYEKAQRKFNQSVYDSLAKINFDMEYVMGRKEPIVTKSEINEEKKEKEIEGRIKYQGKIEAEIEMLGKKIDSLSKKICEKNSTIRNHQSVNKK